MNIKVYSKYGAEYVPVCMEEESAGYDIISPENIELGTDYPEYLLDLGIVLVGPRTNQGWDWCYKMIPRSSSSKYCLTFANTIGVIDSSYRGPEDTLKVALLFNPPKALTKLGKFNEYIGKLITPKDKQTLKGARISIKKGDRIGQLVFQPIFKPTLEYSGDLEDHPGLESRGGFGSTGE